MPPITLRHELPFACCRVCRSGFLEMDVGQHALFEQECVLRGAVKQYQKSRASCKKCTVLCTYIILPKKAKTGKFTEESLCCCLVARHGA